MPVYHFNIHSGISVSDPDGHELPDLDAAKQEAVKLSGNIIRELGPDFWTGDGWALEVTDASGTILFTLVFFASLPPSTSRPAMRVV